jgi:O-antigen/teichoic acid export membrane protein
LWASADVLVGFFPSLKQGQYAVAVRALRVGSWVILPRLIQQVLVGVEQAYQCYRLTNIINTFQLVFINSGMLVLAGLGGRTLELMAWHAVTSIGGLIAHSWVGLSLLSGIKLRLILDIKKAREILHYSVMTWLISVGSALFSQCDRLIVGALLGTETLGVYAAITNVTGQINSFSALPVQPLLPALSNWLERPNFEPDKLQQTVKKALRINAIVALGLGGVLLTLSPWVIKVMIPGGITDEWVFAFRLATIIYALYSVNAVGYYILFSLKAVKISLFIQLLSGSFSLLLISLGASQFGLLGAIVGNAGYLGVWFLNLVAMRKLNIPLGRWSRWLSYLLIWFALSAAVSFFIPPDNLLAQILILTGQAVILLFPGYLGAHRLKIKHLIGG